MTEKTRCTNTLITAALNDTLKTSFFTHILLAKLSSHLWHLPRSLLIATTFYFSNEYTYTASNHHLKIMIIIPIIMMNIILIIINRTAVQNGFRTVLHTLVDRCVEKMNQLLRHNNVGRFLK